MDCVIALDVGGTGIKAALVAADGTVLHQDRRPTERAQGPDAVVLRILDFAADLSTTAGELGHVVVGAGVVVPGIVDEVTGIAINSSNIGWRDVPLRALLDSRLGMPVALGHDVRAGGLAEGRHGAATGCSDYLFMPIGTGIGGALVVGGRPVTGASGQAGEIGHLIVAPGGERCHCGARGCLETVASASAIAARYGKQGRPAIDAQEVATLAEQGDPVARNVWADAVEALADATVAVTTLVDLQLVVVGGGLALAGEWLLQPLRSAVAAKVQFQNAPRLVRAGMGERAGCVGAALLAWDRLGGRPS